MTRPVDISRFIGTAPDRLSIPELRAVHGKWAAIEIYSPEVNPERLIVAMGNSPAQCTEALLSKGLDPGKYEFQLLRSPL